MTQIAFGFNQEKSDERERTHGKRSECKRVNAKRNERVRATITKLFHYSRFQQQQWRVDCTPFGPIWQVEQRWA